MTLLVHCGKVRLDAGCGDAPDGDVDRRAFIGECERILGVVLEGENETPCISSVVLRLFWFDDDEIAIGALVGGASDVRRGCAGCAGCSSTVRCCCGGDEGEKRDKACDESAWGAAQRRGESGGERERTAKRRWRISSALTLSAVSDNGVPEPKGAPWELGRGDCDGEETSPWSISMGSP